jgi:hypothetical protein
MVNESEENGQYLSFPHALFRHLFSFQFLLSMLLTSSLFATYHSFSFLAWNRDPMVIMIAIIIFSHGYMPIVLSRRLNAVLHIFQIGHVPF